MPEYVSCTTCGEEVTSDSDFCPHCGTLFAGSGQTVCDTHADRRGTAVCIICHRLLCEECSGIRDGRRFCSDHTSVKVQQDWAKVFQSTEINEAELVRSVLENAEFHVQVQNFNSIGFVWDGGGDSPQSRSNIGKPAKVFVPIPEFLKAQALLMDWESGKSEEDEEPPSKK